MILRWKDVVDSHRPPMKTYSEASFPGTEHLALLGDLFCQRLSLLVLI
jgi:hypothetical protein